MTDNPPAPFKQDSLRTHALELTARIVSAHVSNNPMQCAELPRLIQQVYQTLVQVSLSSAASVGRIPAVPVNRSVFPDYIVCLENGRRLKTLRRHLMAAFGFTPEQYRRRWGLPYDYPMVASNYVAERASLARTTGLGHASSRTWRKAASSQ
jgi:predicted transcriptional regulator